MKNSSKEETQENSKPVKRDINIPEAITVRELANRMAEQSSNVIKYLFGMGVTVTINQTLAADTAEFLVKEFGHNPISCLLYTSPSPRDRTRPRMPSSA